MAVIKNLNTFANKTKCAIIHWLLKICIFDFICHELSSNR